ncbi:MAG: hypothetical protein J1F05_07985 [Muribaculaceae bacterium]|nr:hypothetical protein [Muribaculaceae bacterium]
MNHKYRLRPYRQGGKDICPECEQRSFVPYIDNETGEILHPTCGRCDHEQSCGYHLTPSDYFKQNPERRPTSVPCTTYIKPTPTIIDWGDVSEWKSRQSVEEAMRCDFAKAMCNVFDMEDVAQAISRYLVQSVNANTAYPCISIDGRVTDVMVLNYGEDLHRGNVCYHYYGKEQKEQLKVNYPNGFRYSPCFFGEHLLTEQPDSNVAIVESQKSAVVCSIVFPSMVWLATCGCGNFKIDKCNVLRDRRVFVYADKGSESKWGVIVEEMKCKGYNIHHRPVMQDLPEYVVNTDIADVLLDNLKHI